MQRPVSFAVRNKILSDLLKILLISLIFFSCKQSLRTDVLNGTASNDTVLIVTMSFSETELLKAIKEKISSFYNCKVKITSAPLPAFAFVKDRNRYKADSLLKYLYVLNRNGYRFVAGLTSKDISTTKEAVGDWGIFGLGSFEINTCVSSTFRLKKNVPSQVLLERLQKVILHEIGHNYGLRHCTTSDPCFMKDAEGKISTVDNEPMDMCKSCKAKM